jgi:hypothetical protein
MKRPLLVAPHQFVKRCLVADLAAFQQFLVGDRLLGIRLVVRIRLYDTLHGELFRPL